MLRAALNSFGGFADHSFGHSSFSLTFVRWRRKPRWVPVAKSKMFRVPEKPTQNEDEKRELLRLHNNYKTQIRSIRYYLHQEVEKSRITSSASHLILTPDQEEAEWQKCMEENNAWNNIIATQRNVRVQQDLDDKKALALKRIKLADELENERLAEADKIVAEEKERAKFFITKDNLDSAIEFALANPVDPNFCIDLKGNLYSGRETPTQERAEKNSVSV